MKKENFFGYGAYTFGSSELQVCVFTLGATVYSIKYKGQETVLNYADAQSYLDGTAFINAAIGRYGNRIGDARFTLNGKEYVLTANEGKNQLHGGPMSYDKRVWQAEVKGENSVRMSIFSPDGDNGFPGNLTAGITYTVEGSTLRMDFDGITDADTVYAPTSHLYFNLDGSKSILDHKLWINSPGWLEIDEGLIPTGNIIPTEGDFDFNTLRPVAQNYDHCFTLGGEHARTLECRKGPYGHVYRLPRHADVHRLCHGRTPRRKRRHRHRARGLSRQPQQAPVPHNYPQSRGNVPQIRLLCLF